MAMNVRRVPDSIVYALLAAANQRQVDAISTSFHLSRTEDTNLTDYTTPSVTRVTVTHAAATDAATRITLANQIKSVLDRHFVDDIAHDSAVSAVITIADSTDAATAITLANDLKAKLNVHLTASNVHFTNDSTNTVTNADATDAATLEVLVNEIRGDAIAHLASAPAGTYLNLVPA